MSDTSDTFIMNFFPLHRVPQSCAWISLTSCVVVLTLACLLRLHANSFGKLICGVLLGNIFSTLPKVMAFFLDLESVLMCEWLEAIEFFGRNSNFLWSMCFAHASYTVITKLDIKHIQTNLKYYTLLSIILPLLLSIIQPFTDYVSYAHDMRTCVHEVTVGEIDVLYILFGDLPLVTISGLSIYFYINCLLGVRDYFTEHKSTKTYTLMLYPAIMLLCWLPSAVINVLMVFGARPGPINTILWLECLPLLQGFFDALAYGVSRQVVRRACRMECLRKKQVRESFISQSESESHYSLQSKQLSLYEQFQAINKDETKVEEPTLL